MGGRSAGPSTVSNGSLRADSKPAYSLPNPIEATKSLVDLPPAHCEGGLQEFSARSARSSLRTETPSDEFTSRARRQLESLDESASDKLTTLMRFIVERDLTRYDIVIRAWATHHEGVARIVRDVDRERLSTVRDLFAAIGFSGDELEHRARLLVTYMSFEASLDEPRSRRRRLEELPALHALLTSAPMTDR